MQETPTLDMFLKNLITAPKARQDDAIQSALARLKGKPADRLLYSGAEACRLLSISASGLWRLRQAKKITPIHVLARPKYRRCDLEELARGGGVS